MMKEVDQRISRRDLLREAGIVLALPFLQQSLPANVLASAATPSSRRRTEKRQRDLSRQLAR